MLLMAALGAVVILLIGIAVGEGAHGNLGFSTDTLSSWVAALATTAIAILTVILAKETWALRRLQLDQIEQIRKDALKPAVSVALRSSRHGLSFMNVHISNKGAGIARNIRFRFVNCNPDAEDVFNSLQQHIEKLTILSEGISALAAGEELNSFLFSFIDLTGKYGDRSFQYFAEVHIDYEDIEGTKYTSVAHWKFREQEGITELGGDPIVTLSDAVGKIEKSIDKLVTGWSRLEANIYTRDDRAQERKDREERFEQMRNSKESGGASS